MSSSLCPLRPQHRIVTSHTLPFPPAASGLEPSVELMIDEPIDESVWHSAETPATSNSSTVDRGKMPVSSLVVKNGANCRTTSLAPGQVTSMHRTSSLDYNIITDGRITLLTPLVPSRPEDWPPSTLTKTREDIEERICEVGDIVVQRGTMHAWRNDTTEWVRWACVLTDATPAIPDLPAVWVVEGAEKGTGVAKYTKKHEEEILGGVEEPTES